MTKRQIIRTTESPSSPYFAQATRAAGLIFVSGTPPLNPASGEVVGETVGEQVRQCLTNIDAVLRAAGSSLDRIVSATFLLRDPDDFGPLNDEWLRWFPVDPPARYGAKMPIVIPGVRITIAAIAAA